MKYSTLAVLALALLVTGCSNTAPKPIAASNPSQDYLQTNSAKILFYAAYSDENDLPYFNQTFRLHIDGGYIQDIEADQYTETRLPPGKHVINVDQISWAGDVLKHSKLTLYVASGTATYIREQVIPDEKPILSQVDAAQGAKDIAARGRICLCSSPLSKLFD
jgi:hypothetical protein